MENKRRHFVLVHGACHGAWCWYKVATILKLAGNKVTAMDLGASGVDPKQINDLLSISDYFDPLLKFMESLPAEEKVILVGHSMGGISISAAMERFPEKVSVAVFATAFMPGPDISFDTILKKFTITVGNLLDTQYIYGDSIDSSPTAFLFGPQCLQVLLYQLSPPEYDCFVGNRDRRTAVENYNRAEEDYETCKSQA